MKNTKKIRIFAIFSFIDYANEFYWYAKHIDKNKYKVFMFFLNPTKPSIIENLINLDVDAYFIKYRGKKSVLPALLKIFYYMLKFKPDIVHAQLFDASFLALWCAKLLAIKRRIYTRHHADLHHVYHPHAVKYDCLINKWAKKIICPSEQTKKILTEKEKVPVQKIEVIKHGFDFSSFQISNKNEMLQKYQIKGQPVIGVVSRFTEWKGVQYIIPAFKMFLEKYNNALLVLAGSEGDYSKPIYELLKTLPLNTYKLISFEKNIYTLMSIFDIFIHVPTYREAESFGQVYVEAFALAIPSIITLSGVAADSDIFAKYAEVVEYRNTEQIYHSLIKITENYNYYKEKFLEASKIVQSEFTFEKKIRLIEKVYENLC